jgi:transcriptional regulator with XRE-family HTH domain
MDENKHRNSNQLVLIRKRMHLSQKRVARAIGLRDASVLSRYESGRALPPLKTALKLAALYDATLSEMFHELSRRCRMQVLGREDERITLRRGRLRKNAGRST